MGVVVWLRQRYSAALLVPLCIWLVLMSFSVLKGHKTLPEVLSHPCSTILLISTIFIMLYHANIGMMMVVPDYIKSPAARLVVLSGIRFCTMSSGFVAIFAVLNTFLVK